MVKGKAKRQGKSPQRRKKQIQSKRPSRDVMERVEFHRHALALLPAPEDRHPGVAIFVKGKPDEPAMRFCSCSVFQRQTCAHTLEMAKIYKSLQQKMAGRTLEEDFKSSIWYRLAFVIAEDSSPLPAKDVELKQVSRNGVTLLKAFGPDGEEVLTYFSRGRDLSRFIERFTGNSHENITPQRGAILERLSLLTLTGNERIMLERGFRTRRQALEESFWYRAAYHGYREVGAQCAVTPAIDEVSGGFTVTFRDLEAAPICRMVVPRQKVKKLLLNLRKLLPNQHDLAIHPIPLKSIFKVSMNTELDLEVRPIIQVIQENGEASFFEREDLERFVYGDLIYVKELGLMAELESPDRERRFKSPVRMVLKKSQVPTFLDEFGDEIREGIHIVDASVEALQVFNYVDRITIGPEALDRDWCWLSITYGFGNTTLALAEILRAKGEGQRYVAVKDGWVDCQSPALRSLDGLMITCAEDGFPEEDGRIRLSRMDLFRMLASLEDLVDVMGQDDRARLLKRMLALKPAEPLPALRGMTSTLRAYQVLGVEWILFLFENRFGGLLCDDMGLGKTHQVMAFMLLLKESKKVKDPFLVICPTTVLSHWTNKIYEHAPGLKTGVYHGGERDLQEALKTSDVILTSYGILRRDLEQLRSVSFSLAVFDEIQHIKNPQTQIHQAASSVQAEMKLGLTGTPIENTLHDLKALMDLTVPGYLGSNEIFDQRYAQPVELDPKGTARGELRRLISPFTLRRLKKTVLHELPDKIEDIRTCRLAEDQVKLYRDALSSRGKGIMEVLRKGQEPVPYMHIFALLSLLKQICNHPATLEDQIEDFETYGSGKWELFKELLSESLDSGQKVVVYSQFLRMIRIIERFLQALDVDFVTLTGASRNRGRVIARFNEDPGCRVYVGSLKAGGTGVDLVAASVVIHYDRWWNAAREDQATDRVHRIGQKRGVQVFKMVTEGTLEEKISAIIDKKRNLMDSVIEEDDPNLLKAFSREQLLELLQEPS
jgi:superfamily II DNA or RNA helicase